MAETIRFLVERGVPVMGHIGLTPQSINTIGSFRAQGREENDWGPIEDDARAVSDAGAFSVVIEAVAEPLARKITADVPIPTIGIGGSVACDGQILVLEDMLGLSPRVPKFVRRYGDLGPSIAGRGRGLCGGCARPRLPGPGKRLSDENKGEIRRRLRALDAPFVNLCLGSATSLGYAPIDFGRLGGARSRGIQLVSDASDVFREVDEEVRREQLKKLWERYGHYAVALAVLAGRRASPRWRGYRWWEAKKAAEAGAAFEAAIALSDAGKHAEAEAAFAKIADDGSSGYRSLARLREAAELAQTDPKAAVAAYEKISNDSSDTPVVRDLAALRAGALLVDAANYPDAQRVLEPLTAPDRTFRHTARELLALAAWRQGDGPGTKRWFDMMATDPLTPTATRTRAEMLMALVAAESKS